MIYSMTAYAEKPGQGPWGSLRVEIRSVNHRYLEMYFKLPDSLRQLETGLRELVKKHVHRGKVECSLYFHLEKQAQTWFINESLVEQILLAASQVESKITNARPLSAMDILTWPDVIRKNNELIDLLGETVMATFEQTLIVLCENRAREGLALGEMLLTRISKMRGELLKIDGLQSQIIQQLKQKFLNKIKELNLKPDESRLEQEMVFWAQKSDVSEELDRLNVHLKEVESIIGKGGVIGRRLDFLMQELNRETNTLASKAMDSLTSAVAVELKVLIEQMREQVQNIE